MVAPGPVVRERPSPSPGRAAEMNGHARFGRVLAPLALALALVLAVVLASGVGARESAGAAGRGSLG